MKSNTKKIIVLIILGIGFVFLPNIKLNFSVDQKTNLSILKESGAYSEPFIHIDGSIPGNWSDTVSDYLWCDGSGTWNDPYIIENVTINAINSPTGSGIYINNSMNDYFTIRNCTVYNAVSGVNNAGIKLENTCNGTLIDNNCSNNAWGGILLVTNCDNNTLSGNTANNNTGFGIYLENNCSRNTLSGNTANDNIVSGIYLENNCDNNILSGNTANGNDNDGIRLATECDDNTISGNTVDKNIWYGIELWKNCDNNTLSGNTANNNTHRGIHLDNCDNITISDNTANYNTYFGIYLYQSHYTNITGNTANYNDDHGIYLENNCDRNTLSGNTANYNDDHGIYLENNCDNNILSGNTANGNDNDGIRLATECDDNTISGNTVDKNIWYGIELWKNCDNNTLSGNTANNNTHRGIYLENNCDNNTISDNTANNNTYFGIYLYNDCSRNTLSGNTANYNWNGIYLYYCNNNTISGNTAYDNDNCGILLSYCDNNTISGNTANDNDNYGIYLGYCNNNTISGNLAEYNQYGILFEFECHFNKISGNIIKRNNFGISFENLGCNNNSIYKNFFLENEKHAVDYGTDNKWNSTTIGNYWDNWTSPDVNNDGIVDDPYTLIGGSAESIDYLPIAEDGAPTISINSPVSGDTFSVTAPSFNVIITDDYLDEMWYTIDGGLNNYSFTENGMISQSAWNKAAEGNITLTFYASDIPGNIGTEEVMIAKDYEAPIINIISPTTGEFFGSSAPSFNVRIIDDYLDTMWYTLDGGLHNYTFTANGTIVQSAWNSMGDGAIIIGFFANDTLGHIGSAGMTLHKDTVAPVIIITSPKEGDRFGNTAPLFNITITEINLDEIWYSYDEGLTIFVITDNGTLNQAAWTALAQGEVTITFYASDLAGNEASESVTVFKSVPSGLDPGVIITIIIVSVVGGVAVVAGVYFFMRKRATPE